MHLLQDWTRKDHLSNVQAMLPRELKLRPGEQMVQKPIVRSHANEEGVHPKS
jgi:hypothetical protein